MKVKTEMTTQSQLLYLSADRDLLPGKLVTSDTTFKPHRVFADKTISAPEVHIAFDHFT